ncbi:hypothetical protein H9M94_03005 [Mycoplasma sp. Pen4]|uniref:MPN527 family putative ECF transporter permease subunit n=1 Tax=Mycoplasma sp. Pen4 TaxID=640330 RepID=UPI001654506A|nr:hypothetical protein [Mycoplasma sp. Pen4]QNM93550.1 hypothetical protein H9M94_03005 [Mycoplasma sp. Pen4]
MKKQILDKKIHFINHGMSYIFKISFTGIFLAVAILLSLIGGFIKVFNFLSLNFSFIAIFIIFYVIGYDFAFLAIIANLAITPLVLVNSGSDISIRYLGNFIISIWQMVFLSSYILFYNSLHAKFKRWNNIFNHILSGLISILIAAFVLMILNTFLFNVIYFRILNIIKSFSLKEITEIYPMTLKNLFFGVQNYYFGSFLLYFVFNLLNITSNFIIILIFILWDEKQSIANNLRNVHQNHKY